MLTAVSDNDFINILRGHEDVVNATDFPPTAEVVLKVKERLGVVSLPNDINNSWASVLLFFHGLKCDHVPDPKANDEVFRECSRVLAIRVSRLYTLLAKSNSSKRKELLQRRILEDLAPQATSSFRSPTLPMHNTSKHKWLTLSTLYTPTTSPLRGWKASLHDAKKKCKILKKRKARCEELEEEVKTLKSTFKIQTRNVNKRFKRLEEQLFNQQVHIEKLEEAVREAQTTTSQNAKTTISTKTRLLKQLKSKHHKNAKGARAALHDTTNVVTKVDGAYDQRSRALVMDLRTVANINPDSCPKAIRVMTKHFGVNLSSIPSVTQCHRICHERAVVNEHYIAQQWAKSDQPTNVVRASDGTTDKNINIEAEQIVLKQGDTAKHLAIGLEWQSNHTSATQVKGLKGKLATIQETGLNTGIDPNKARHIRVASVAVQQGDHAADVPKGAKLCEEERKAVHGPDSTVLIGGCCEHKGDNISGQGLTAGFKISWSLRTKVELGLGEGYALTADEVGELGEHFKARALCQQDLEDLWVARGYADDHFKEELTSLEAQGLPKHTVLYFMSSVSSPVALPNKWQVGGATEVENVACGGLSLVVLASLALADVKPRENGLQHLWNLWLVHSQSEDLPKLRAVGKARFHEKSRNCGALFLLRHVIRSFFEHHQAAHESVGNLNKNIYEGLGDRATILELCVAYLFYHECGFGFSSVKAVVDDIWDMGPRYDHIEEELLKLIKDPRPLLDGKEAYWRSPLRSGPYPHIHGTDVQRPKVIIVQGIREYLMSLPAEEYLLAAGLMSVCLNECLRVFRNFAKTQLASQGGTLRKEVVPSHVRDTLPTVPISNSELESLLGRFKQERRKKYNQKPRVAEVQVQSRALGFYHDEGAMGTLTPGVLRYAMQETRRRQPEETRKVVVAKHTEEVFEALQEQIDTVQRRQQHRQELVDRYTTLIACNSDEGVDILLRGPSRFSGESQPLARVKAQLNRWKHIDKAKGVHFSKQGKTLTKEELAKHKQQPEPQQQPEPRQQQQPEPRQQQQPEPQQQQQHKPHQPMAWRAKHKQQPEPRQQQQPEPRQQQPEPRQQQQQHKPHQPMAWAKHKQQPEPRQQQQPEPQQQQQHKPHQPMAWAKHKQQQLQQQQPEPQQQLQQPEPQQQLEQQPEPQQPKP
ncbi:hypothetical protein CYMTET_55851 [Cymbomonas tetramitiformis]|uniref:Uncharacterized protein n=1 Tax=Cymbomonas tetramitiformis TaxID=36881 RepID=A0AAE0BC58_9CHLO|nr:hypothetical protein CYMTET_55851 [Cymbomonas tetramitiformis]